ncbi:hypothetical protein FNV43_RR10981 [Rhamnella rubrinervis]|uniref:PUM-HD domain-containing protein n=1 Tax=Rhamnella rubrinervis TaxID=2594499 RepID=A0A8K0MGU2_9ROSA|nr:hypothetical protein FNV43_RR10981 [Rhamnella rubrinervis]
MIETTKRDGELEKLFNAVTITSHLNPLHRRHDNQLLSGSAVCRDSLKSEYSPPSSVSDMFHSSGNGSTYANPYEEAKYQRPSTHHLYKTCLDSEPSEFHINEELINDMGLPENSSGMHISDEQENSTQMRGFEIDPDEFVLCDGSFGRDTSWNFVNPCSYEDFNSHLSDYEACQSSPTVVPVNFDDPMRSAFLRLRQGCKVGDSVRSCLTRNQADALNSSTSHTKNRTSHLLGQKTKQNEEGCCCKNVELLNSYFDRTNLNDDFVRSQFCGKDSSGGNSLMGSLSSSRLLQTELAMNVNDLSHNFSTMKERTKVNRAGGVTLSQAFKHMKSAGNLEGSSCEDSFIMEENFFNPGMRNKLKSSWDHMYSNNVTTMPNAQEKRSSFGGVCENGGGVGGDCLPKVRSLAEVQGYICFLAKDQYGCRFLQRLLDDANSGDVQIICNVIICQVVELMVNPFGNYLVQKVLEICSEEQRMQIVLLVIKEPGQLVEISLNTHGTRAVQKLIETLKDRRQISLVLAALEPGFLDLIKDLNGNHVIKLCLQCLSNEDNKLILDAAAKFCFDAATHKHGCCVLQHCIAHSTRRYRDKLVTEVSRNGLFLAQDPYGNYVVQYIIELKIPSITAKLIYPFKGHFVELSMQKFSSHVVEKCLEHFEESRSRIIHEFLSVSCFEQLLQDPYANYVIQSALAFTEGHLHALLVEAVRPYKKLRTNPYCKKIFSHNLLKK